MGKPLAANLEMPERALLLRSPAAICRSLNCSHCVGFHGLFMLSPHERDDDFMRGGHDSAEWNGHRGSGARSHAGRLEATINGSPAPVDEQHGAGHETRGIRGEEHCWADHFIGARPTVERAF